MQRRETATRRVESGAACFGVSDMFGADGQGRPVPPAGGAVAAEGAVLRRGW